MKALCRFGIIALLASATAAQANTVQVQLGLGYPLTLLKTTEQDTFSLKAKAVIDGSVSLHMQRYPFALGVFYEGFFKSDFGSLPAGSTGVLVTYYPFGRIFTEDNIDNHIFVGRTGVAISFTAATGLTFLNIRPQGNHKQTFPFGASAFDFKVGANLEYPISQTTLIGMHISYFSTLLGTADDGTHQVDVGLNGFNFMVSGSFLIF